MSVLAMTSATAPWRTPPSEVKSFWYSIRTSAVMDGSIDMEYLSRVGCLVNCSPGGHRRRRLLTSSMLSPLALGRAKLQCSRVRPMRLSARNQLAGVVVRVEHGAVMSTVVVRLPGGEQVTAAITRDSAEGLEVAAGDAVKAIIKSTEVMIGKD